jgi:hypothetical protein
MCREEVPPGPSGAALDVLRIAGTSDIVGSQSLVSGSKLASAGDFLLALPAFSCAVATQ